MEISSATAAASGLKFNSSQPQAVDYNPPPPKEGIAPSREAIAAQAQAADPRGRNLDIFA